MERATGLEPATCCMASSRSTTELRPLLFNIIAMKSFLVWGLGRSGRAVEKLLKTKGYKVFSGDDARGDRWEGILEEVDAVVLSPGIPPKHPLWKRALELDKEILGELEVAWRFFKGKTVAITGTDGKSTTVRLTRLLLESAGIEAKEGGNIGKPLSELILEGPPSVAVLEVSSFQGKTLKTFKPDVGSFLNFSEDHLDWHPSLEDYLESKYRIFQNQGPQDIFVAGSDQEEILKTPTKAKKINVRKAVEIRNGSIFYEGTFLFKREDLNVRGEHNLWNTVVACVIALSLGADPSTFRETIRNFKGLDFRLQKVAQIGGIEIYNDSKATTPNALKTALESFPDGKVILIAGGKDKGADFDLIKEVSSRKVKRAFLIGETREKLLKVIGKDRSEAVGSLEDAVKKAFESAQEGDVILFSPGCSSFDMFESYVHRGRVFNDLIISLCSKRFS